MSSDYFHLPNRHDSLILVNQSNQTATGFFHRLGLRPESFLLVLPGEIAAPPFEVSLPAEHPLNFAVELRAVSWQSFLVEDGVGLEKIWWKDSGKMGKIDSLNYFIPRVFPKLSHIHQPFYLEQHEGGLSRV